MSNFNESSITHILVLCPRGFRNERSTYPIPADLTPQATSLVQRTNPEGNADLSAIYSLENSTGRLRSRAALTLREWETDEYQDFLADELGFAE